LTADIHKGDRHGESEAYAADGSHLKVDAAYWEEAAGKDRIVLCNQTLFETVAHDEFQFRFLDEDVRLDLHHHCLRRNRDGMWQREDDPLLTLATVVYLKNVDGVYPLGRDIVGISDLKQGGFFTGPHELRTASLLKRFGDDPESFRKAGKAIGGHPMDMADAAVRLHPFPRVPLYYLLWTGDEEFQPRLQVLLDRSIERFLPADAIWALINRVTRSFEQA
jgi:hypothetical protein